MPSLCAISCKAEIAKDFAYARLRISENQESENCVFTNFAMCNSRFLSERKIRKKRYRKIQELLHQHSPLPACGGGCGGPIMQADCVSSSPVGALLADVIHILRGVTALAVA